ncbi:UNVERIFIED_CONTAM: hypothetical protein GTU68_005214 [Idotea baltica]|nr:hypothetical protein [Idotea baltica]
MRPEKKTPAHKTGDFAELVCSNSFRGAALNNAVGVLKEELKLLDSLIMNAALHAEVPAGGALAVDRKAFSDFIEDTIKKNPLVEVIYSEAEEIPEFSKDNPVIIATGPLTSESLTDSIQKLTGTENLAFFDAISPIVTYDSLNLDLIFRQSRYDKGGDDYLNIALNEEQYIEFITEVDNAEKYSGNHDVENDSLDKLRPFEGCMPIEDMISRGPETLRYGPFKPKGLTDKRTGISPHAVLQLRQDDKEGFLWSMVGMQTRMKRHEQIRIFKSLPGLEDAEFVRYGTVHRNTFIESPKCLNSTLDFKDHSGLFFAGQITGVEGYVESTSSGLVAGINAARMVLEQDLVEFPEDTAIGSLMAYISDEERKGFQPMNVSFGLFKNYQDTKYYNGRRLKRRDRRIRAAKQALNIIEGFKDSNIN